METLLVISYSYLSGSIPFGLILTKILIKKDIRKIGSGNIGATNVLRTGNKFIAAITLIMDIAKGFVPVLISQLYFPDLIQISALLAFLGHLFPIWLNFKGGKGVATYLGILLSFSYGLGILFIFTWITVSLIFKYSSLSSMFASLTVFVITFFRESFLNNLEPNLNNGANIQFLFFIFLILIIFTHKKNIINLKNKKEKKIKI